MADNSKGTMPEPFKTNPGRAAEPAPAVPRHHTPEHGAEQAAEVSRQVKQAIERNRLPDVEPTRFAGDRK